MDEDGAAVDDDAGVVVFDDDNNAHDLMIEDRENEFGRPFAGGGGRTYGKSMKFFRCDNFS